MDMAKRISETESIAKIVLRLNLPSNADKTFPRSLNFVYDGSCIYEKYKRQLRRKLWNIVQIHAAHY